MPAEPESSPVEAMLRDDARRRRDAFDAAGPGPATMPGPTRARLHEELARRFDEAPARGATSSDGGLARWWLAFAGAAGAAAVVALFVVAIQKAPERPAAVAANPAPAAAPREVATPAPAVPPPAPFPAPAASIAPGVVAIRQDQPAPGAVPASPLSKAKDAPGDVSASTVTAGVMRAQTFTQSPLPLAAIPTKAAGLAHRAVSAPAAAPAPGARGGAGATAQADAARPAPPSLLGNFRFEQRGENVRVVDADGSVYVGQVEVDKAPPQAQGTLRANKAQSAADAVAQSPEASAAAENFRFRATGDNRTLRKPVVFEGEYTAPLPEVANGLKLDSKAANSQPQPNTEAQIRGRVRVLDGRDDQRPAEVDARSVRPATLE